MDLYVGDCFSRFAFLDAAQNIDESLDEICKKVPAHTNWIRTVLHFTPISLIAGKKYENVLLTAGDDELLKFWEISDGKCLQKSLICFAVHAIQELCVQIRGLQNQFLVIGGELGKLIIYDYSEDKTLIQLKGEERNIYNIKVFLQNNSSNKSQYPVIATSNSKGDVRIWDWMKGVTLFKIMGGFQPAQGLCICYFNPNQGPNSFKMLLFSQEETIYGVNPKNGKILKRFRYHSEWVKSIACRTLLGKNPEGRSMKITLLVSTGADNTVRLFNILRNETLFIYDIHQSGGLYLEISDDNIISSDAAGNIIIISLRTMKKKKLATGLSLDYYKSLTLLHDKENGDLPYLCVVGSVPRSGYHYLHMYKGYYRDSELHFTDNSSRYV